MNRITMALIIIFSVFLNVSLPAQEQSYRTGIVDFYIADKSIKNGPMVISQLGTVLGRYSFISVVERSKLGNLVEEITMGQSGLLNTETAAKEGKIHGLQVLIEGTISKNNISARAIHTETAKVIASGTITSIDEMESLGKKIASGIETFIARENVKRLRNNSPDINLSMSITTKDGKKIGADGSPGTIKIGTSVGFSFTSDTDGFVTIIDIQPGGDIVVLFPNDFSGSNAVKAGVKYSIPSNDDQFEIVATEPAGEDTVVAFLTKRKVDWLDPKKLTGEGFKTVKDGEKVNVSRAFSVAATKLTKKEWESAVINTSVVK